MVVIIDDVGNAWMGGCDKGIFLKMTVVIVRLTLSVSLFVMAVNVFAGEWDSSRSLSLSGIYSSNVGLASENESDDLITRVRPDVNINGSGRRLNFSFSYAPEILAYKNSPSRNELFHKLYTGANVEIVPETFFFDGNASIRQSIIDTKSPIRFDNMSLGNQTEVMMLNVGPSVSHDFNGYLRGHLSYKLGFVKYTDTESLPDSESDTTVLTFGSGRYFRRLTWEGSYTDSVIKRDADALRTSAKVSVRYKLTRSLAALIKGGYENNQFKSETSLINGSYSSAGFSWNPSKHISLDATKGDLSEDANLVWTPYLRTMLRFGYTNRDVGVNTGSVWSGRISHRAKRSTWQASYQEDVTNFQFLEIVGQQTFAQIDAQGDLVIDPVSGFPAIVTTNIFGLRDEEFLRKRSNISYTLSTGKTDLSFSPYKESRKYQLSGETEDVLGATVSWGWRFASKTRSLSSISWQDRGFSSTNRKDSTKRASVQLIKNINRWLQVSAEYRYVERISTTQGNEYRDHQFIASLTKQFQRN